MVKLSKMDKELPARDQCQRRDVPRLSRLNGTVQVWLGKKAKKWVDVVWDDKERRDC